MTRRRLVAAATTILALLLQAPPVRANTYAEPFETGLDRGDGTMQVVVIERNGEVAWWGPVRRIEPPAPPRQVPGIAVPVVYAGGGVDAALAHAAAAYGVSPACLRTIAWRESRNRPWVDNEQGSGARGLMQFMDGTWAFMAPRAGYGGASVYDGWAAAHVAAWAIANPGPSQGGLRHWGGSC